MTLAWDIVASALAIVVCATGVCAAVLWRRQSVVLRAARRASAERDRIGGFLAEARVAAHELAMEADVSARDAACLAAELRCVRAERDRIAEELEATRSELVRTAAELRITRAELEQAGRKATTLGAALDRREQSFPAGTPWPGVLSDAFEDDEATARRK